MIDLVSLLVKAGDGGHGRVSFRREKYVPKGGPDGGQGGSGGDVRLVGSSRVNTLKHYAGKKEIVAQNGAAGGVRQKTGADADDIVLEVPVGTTVWLLAENQASYKRREKYSPEHHLTRGEVTFEQYHLAQEGQGIPPREEDELQPLAEGAEKIQLAEITEAGQEIILCQGGFGGRGNVSFKASTNTTPLQAEYGTFGEQKKISLELKLLADIGLVGLPNAGKSTLLSKITRANPKTADYPFTTIEPNLGVLNLAEGRDLVVADIPGLIEGASQGKGLGHDFLRHIENSQALIFVLFLEESVVSDEGLNDEKRAELVWEQYQQLRTELKEHNPELLAKPSLVSLNKLDLYSPELVAAIEKRFTTENLKLHVFSGFTGKGLEELLSSVAHLPQE